MTARIDRLAAPLLLALYGSTAFVVWYILMKAVAR